ncbi:ubiquinol-cytochrome C chaperone [Aquabacter sp. L1I39]|uniref:ubiquinol-cytochrome C chaperone family protein n=1 Tax=Aquabacter sp. L1I39 TaxID=2820278 RepID=UPI001ADA6821|nr:ubiquinol-cytochrome C chaperone family protein [Aquabacter sp. L1I39]QTL02623.1 ubiquinol-cytochrome C chaperone [Aquabacter sp. L1I39]
MLKLFRRNKTPDTIERLYGAIVAQARQPAFYMELGVPDTVEGRFELLLLHTFLVCHRLKGEGEAGQDMSQKVFDAFLDDMDRTLREMGIGDLSVPKRMKKIGQAFYGRTAAYDAALTGGVQALRDALARNVLEADPSLPQAHALATYVEAARDGLAAQPMARFSNGEAAFPPLSQDKVEDHA